jgi:hypothetical protein
MKMVFSQISLNGFMVRHGFLSSHPKLPKTTSSNIQELAIVILLPIT